MQLPALIVVWRAANAMTSLRLRLTLHTLLVGVLVLVLCTASMDASAVESDAHGRKVATGVEYVGQVILPAGLMFEGTQIGGLSAITYDPARDVYYALSDDRGANGPPRFYTLKLGVADGRLESEEFDIVSVTTLRDEAGNPFPRRAIDPEGIVYAGDDTLYIASEGIASARTPVDPFVSSFGLDGRRTNSLVLPEKFLPDGRTRGVRDNLGFESLTLRPDGRYLFAATENALAQDGPVADVDQPSLSRIVAFDTATGIAAREMAYQTDPVIFPPDPADAEHGNGLVELLALDDDGTFLALERSFSVGGGFSVRLYQIRTQGALDVQTLDSLLSAGSDTPLEGTAITGKELLLDLADVAVFVDNIEGMTFGPVLEDGRRTLIFVSDDNFNSFLGPRILAVALTSEEIPTTVPVRESPRLVNQGEPSPEVLAGRAIESEIWIHPTDPIASLVITASGEGGLQVMDIEGQVLQRIGGEGVTGPVFTSVDVLYQFELGGEKVDLVLATDRAGGKPVAWQVIPDDRSLDEVPVTPTSTLLPDGESSITELVTYRSPRNGIPYVFVAEDRTGRIAQLQLRDDGAGGLAMEVVRVIDLSREPGTTEDRPVDMAVDQLRGVLYVLTDISSEVLVIPAEPDASTASTSLTAGAGALGSSQLSGLSVYYGQGVQGYLLATDSVDQSVIMWERSGENAFVGRLAVTDGPGGDQVNFPHGVAVTNVALGAEFPDGLVVIQDSVDDPQDLIVRDGRAWSDGTNFKYLPWQSAAQSFDPPLVSDALGYDPRFPMRVLLPVVSWRSSGIE